jgi:hypothetical protein
MSDVYKKIMDATIDKIWNEFIMHAVYTTMMNKNSIIYGRLRYEVITSNMVSIVRESVQVFDALY